MTSMTFACPETGKALAPMLLDETDTGLRVALHCPKCSRLHAFTGTDALAEDPEALPVGG